MLHEILLSLSGYPTSLLRAGEPETESPNASILPPTERQLLASAAHLSELHINLNSYSEQIGAAHPSIICRAVATAIKSIHLSAFHRKVLDVEESILRDDPALVGAYNIVPLTAVMGEFTPWTRKLEWLWETVQFMLKKGKDGNACQGSQIMDRLRFELQSGYRDVEETTMSLIKVAENAWLTQVSAWVLYGRLPGLGGNDFFIRKTDDAAEYACDSELLPSFVTATTASSMLFIGKSLNHIRVRATVDSGVGGLGHLSSKLQDLASLTFPLNGASFSRTITSIRLSLSENTLQKILPPAKVTEMMQLLRDFFLLGRGEFAMALTHEADEKIRNRWRRIGTLAYEKDEGLKNITVKDGEVAAVLARAWSVLITMQRHQVEEDEQLDLARDLLRLQLTKPKMMTLIATGPGLTTETAQALATSPFQNLLFSVPAVLSIQLPSPLDMVISASDLQLYSCINAYLLSMRRAHLRLTDLWKITSLRRHHPAPRGAQEYAGVLRQRWATRATAMRSSWTTASAAIFFLAETEAYLQTEVVAGLWEGFSAWMTGSGGRNEWRDGRSGMETSAARPTSRQADGNYAADNVDDGDKSAKPASRPSPDHQTLSTAHTLYLRTMVHRLLLSQPRFTGSLYKLLIHIDHLVAHIQRLHSIFTSIDLETDAGVVDAFVDLDKEEREVMSLLRAVEASVRKGIEEVVTTLRQLEGDDEFLAEWEGLSIAHNDNDFDLGHEEMKYTPARLGGINRLLMKLDFGSWINRGDDGWGQN